MNEKERCLRTVQSLEFALVELGLYLDSHPDCKEALAQYKNFNAQHEQAKNQYEMHFGPLTGSPPPSPGKSVEEEGICLFTRKNCNIR